MAVADNSGRVPPEASTRLRRLWTRRTAASQSPALVLQRRRHQTPPPTTRGCQTAACSPCSRTEPQRGTLGPSLSPCQLDAACRSRRGPHAPSQHGGNGYSQHQARNAGHQSAPHQRHGISAVQSSTVADAGRTMYPRLYKPRQNTCLRSGASQSCWANPVLSCLPRVSLTALPVRLTPVHACCIPRSSTWRPTRMCVRVALRQFCSFLPGLADCWIRPVPTNTDVAFGSCTQKRVIIFGSVLQTDARSRASCSL